MRKINENPKDPNPPSNKKHFGPSFTLLCDEFQYPGATESTTPTFHTINATAPLGQFLCMQAKHSGLKS
jgi:hypothetical protein